MYKFWTLRYEWRHNTSFIVYWENIVYYIIRFREGWYGFRKPQCVAPEHRITLCELNSKIGGYVISVFHKAWYKGFFLNSLLSIWLPIISSNTCKTILANWKTNLEFLLLECEIYWNQLTYVKSTKSQSTSSTPTVPIE